MPDFYIVTRFNVNKTTGEEAHSQQKFDTQIAAMKRFYSILAADIDSDNYAYELVQVVHSDGMTYSSQVFDNREPEPDEEPETEA